MPSQVDFGITISCYRGDLPFLKGCLESIRANVPEDIPICLVVDGRMPLHELIKTYEVSVLSESKVTPRLREESYGYGHTKMVAFWHSPFEHFLHIDADAICWGNICDGLPWRDFDFIYNEPHEIIDDRIQREQYFNPKIVFEAFPTFPWEGQPYFNSGIFAARRGILDLDEYLQLRAFQRQNPAAFISGEQGILNFMIFRRIASGAIKARQWPLQAVVPVISIEQLNSRFRFRDGKPVISDTDKQLIHWAGKKPNISRRGPFVEPMTFYRMHYMVRTGSPMRFLGTVALMADEWIARFITVARRGLYSSVTSKLRSVGTRALSQVKLRTIQS